MRTKNAGQKAKGGFYFNLKTWEISLLRKDGDTLPGGAGDRYLRIPTLALLVLGPAMGFLFVIFLPAIGFALAFRELGRKAKGLLGRARHTAKDPKAVTR